MVDCGVSAANRLKVDLNMLVWRQAIGTQNLLRTSKAEN